MDLTPRQGRALMLLKEHYEKHGTPMTSRELGQAMGISHSAAWLHMRKLYVGGHLKRCGKLYVPAEARHTPQPQSPTPNELEQRILDAAKNFYEKYGAPVSQRSLSRELGISGFATLKAFLRLEALGYLRKRGRRYIPLTVDRS